MCIKNKYALIIYGLFNDGVSSSGNVEPKDRINRNALEKICKETMMVHLSYYPSISLKELRENHENTSHDSRSLGQDLNP